MQHELNINLFMFASCLCVKFLFIFTLTLSKLQSMIKTVTEQGLLIALVEIAK